MLGDNVFPVLPLRDIVVFPLMIVPLFVGREKSVRALEDMKRDDKQILLVAQRDAGQDDPTAEDLHGFGTIGTVLQLLKLPDGTVKVLVEGTTRAQIIDLVDNEGFFQAEARVVEEVLEEPKKLEALVRMVTTQFEQYIKLNRKIPPDVLVSFNQIADPSKLADTVAMNLSLEISQKQELLETVATSERLERTFEFMESEIAVLQVEKNVRGRVKRQIENNQSEYYLNERFKAIQKELGEAEGGGDEAGELEERINETKLSEEAREKALHELKKLRSMNPMSPETTVARNYLDWLLAVPWQKRSRVTRDLRRARLILDEDHYGLEKVKERIVEFLAVQQRVRRVKGPILCLVGPPGVGKTSLGKSIARATGRKFVRMSLGGVRDEADIRGHRRTYIGSMPGKIIHGMKKAKTSNPLFLLDEVDKLGADSHGDPTSALLEVLDPEQNNTFNDHYLEVDYDLSDVFFVTTANTLRMPRPLLDRMEIIRLAGYTEDEKTKIAKRHLIPKQLKAHGLKKSEWSISDDALRELIRHYTREAGVRNLEREIALLARKAIRDMLTSERTSVRVTRRTVEKWLGVGRFRFGEVEHEDLVGVSTGLAWTEVGGELLTVEAVVMPGRGKVIHTGSLGEVMRESVQAAWSYVRSRSIEFGIAPTVFEQRDIHVHVPEGATPKEGPSAGVAICTSMVSALTGIPVRKDVAMTGEITLRGRVLPIGGLKEKLLAALRGGVTKVLIPKDNERDLAEIPGNVKRVIEIIPVTSVDEVIALALTSTLTPIEWVESGVDEVPGSLAKKDVSVISTH